LADVEEAEAAASGSYARPTGVLHVTASVLFGQQFLLPILTEFLGENPDVTVRSLFVDRVVNLVDEGIDVAIRIGHLPDSSQSAVRVGKVRQVVCGAPAYFADHGIPQQPADLAKHRMIASTGSFSSLDWHFGQDQKLKVNITPRLFCNTYDGMIRATLEGWGLSRVLSYQIGEHLMEGRLQTVLSDFEQHPLPIHIVHPEGRRASAKVRAFIDLAVDRLRANRLIN
jgi:DNA-binding transcriptional LysR family regulator